MKVALVGILIFIFLILTHALTGPDNNQSTLNTHQGIAVSITAAPSSESMQLHQLPIVTPTPTSTAAPVADCTVPASLISNLPALVATISQKYGVRLGGNALNINRALLTYETMCMAFRSSMYQKSLNSLQHPVTVNFVNSGRCFAWTYSNPPHTDMLEPCTAIIDKYVLIHELVHQMQYGSSLGRNAHFAQWQSQVWNKERNHRIPTGPCIFEDHGDGGECEADAVAEYMFYKVYRNSWGGQPAGGYTFANYPISWPLWYNFVRDNFFGGVTY